MKISNAVIRAAAAVVAAGSAAVAGSATAFADVAADVSAHQLGSAANITNGDVVQAWTVSNLKPSTDTISYQPHGTLWEATASDEAIQGSVIPVVANLNARAANGQNYQVLYGVASSQGVNPATLSQGQKTSGKLYFDVTGDKPNHVVYADGNNVLATWNEPAPGAHGSSGGTATSGRAGAASPVANTAEPSTKPPSAVPAGSQGTPLPSGSQGTPLNTGNGQTAAGTPAPAAGTEAPAGTPATPAPAAAAPGAPAGTPATPAPVANPGAPASAPATPAPAAAGPEAPAAPAPAAPAPDAPATPSAAPPAPGAVGTPTGSTTNTAPQQNSAGTPAS